MAASVAVGLGVALAKAERDRRGARARSARGRRFGLWPEERPAQGLSRMALEQLALAIESLEGDSDGVLAENAVHETRKSLKRLRALIRLLAGELGEEEAARENAVLRDAGRRLAATRDAEVLVATLDDLLERNRSELADRPGVAALRARLAAEHEAVAEVASADEAARAQVLAELRGARGRISDWRVRDRDGIETVEAGLGRIYRQGRRRHRRAARAEGDRARLLHMWRKRVKDLRYAAEMLDRLEPGGRRGSDRRTRARRWAKRRRRGAETDSIRQVARRADELGELLGDEHDLVLLATRIHAENDAQPGDAQRGASEPDMDVQNPDVRAAHVAAAEDASPRPDAAEEASAPAVTAEDDSALLGSADQADVPAVTAEDAGARPRGTGVANAPAVTADDAGASPRATDAWSTPADVVADAGHPGANPDAVRSDAEATDGDGAESCLDEGSRTLLLKLIARRRRRLRKEALRQGRRLYRRRPKAFVARTRDAYERAAHR